MRASMLLEPENALDSAIFVAHDGLAGPAHPKVLADSNLTAELLSFCPGEGPWTRD